MHLNKKPEIEAVVFDLGKVLIDYDFERVLQKVSRGATLTPSEIRLRLLSSDFFFDFECGRISEREFHEKIQRSLNHSVGFDDFCDIWNSIFTQVISPTMEIFLEFRSRPNLKTGILSNTNVLHFTYLQQRMDFLNEKKHVFASHEIRCRKPDAESFNFILKEMDVSAQKTVFIDDLAENIQAAQALGIHGIHATDVHAVRTGLTALGLL